MNPVSFCLGSILGVMPLSLSVPDLVTGGTMDSVGTGAGVFLFLRLVFRHILSLVRFRSGISDQ